MIVDTDVLIDLMQGDERAIAKIHALETDDIHLRIASISLFELYHRIVRVEQPATHRQRIAQVLDTRETYPADDAVMKKAGRIDGRLTAEGRVIGMGDTIIGATALVHEESVLTRNVAHFERIDDLNIDSY